MCPLRSHTHSPSTSSERAAGFARASLRGQGLLRLKHLADSKQKTGGIRKGPDQPVSSLSPFLSSLRRLGRGDPAGTSHGSRA